MAKGMLVFTGTIDLTQFWPENIRKGNKADSDADTIKVKFDPQSVVFTNLTGKAARTDFMKKAGFFHKPTGAAAGGALKFKPVIDSKGQVNMRLQGIDAPELHYMTRVHHNPLYRQRMGETSVVKLFQFLKGQTSGNSIKCEVFTQVNEPNDVFDKFGRCVGDIEIKSKSGKKINVNHWLVESGWAFPTYYDSMTNKEIRDINALGEKARRSKRGIWKFFSQKMSALDRKLTHDPKDGTYSASGDARPPVIFPKLFRRLWTFEIEQQKKFTESGYQKFLAAQKSDRCCKTSVFLKSGFPKRAPLLGSFVDKKGNILFKPAEIVFKEAGTTLKDAKGTPLKAFDMAPLSDIDQFMKFSAYVCGEEDLSHGLGKVYMDIFQNDEANRSEFKRLLDLFRTMSDKKGKDLEKAFRENILADTSLNALTLQVIKLWYLGVNSLLSPVPSNVERLKGGGYYFHHEALIWKIARAHPAGLSKGYYGYWSYKPEN